MCKNVLSGSSDEYSEDPDDSSLSSANKNAPNSKQLDSSSSSSSTSSTLGSAKSLTTKLEDGVSGSRANILALLSRPEDRDSAFPSSTSSSASSASSTVSSKRVSRSISFNSRSSNENCSNGGLNSSGNNNNHVYIHSSSSSTSLLDLREKALFTSEEPINTIGLPTYCTLSSRFRRPKSGGNQQQQQQQQLHRKHLLSLKEEDEVVDTVDPVVTRINVKREEPSFSIYSDIGDYAELLRNSSFEDRDENSNSNLKNKNTKMEKKSTGDSVKAFWEAMNDLNDDQVNDDDDEDDEDYCSSSSSSSLDEATSKSLAVLPTGCHRHPHHNRLTLTKPQDRRNDDDFLNSLIGDYKDTLKKASSIQPRKQPQQQQQQQQPKPPRRKLTSSSLTSPMSQDILLDYRSQTDRRRPRPQFVMESALKTPCSAGNTASRRRNSGWRLRGSDLRLRLGALNLASSTSKLEGKQNLRRRHTTYIKGPSFGSGKAPNMEDVVAAEKPKHVHSWHRKKVE